MRRVPRFLLMRDDFYERPQAAYQAAQSAQYHEPEHCTGFRSSAVYHLPGIRQRLERLLGVRITRWDTDPAEGNGVFYQGFSAGARAEVPGVHADEPLDDITCVVYLTPDLPPDCGTSLWKHRATGLDAAPTPADARRIGRPLAELNAALVRDTRRRERWIEMDRIGYRFNRLVAYPSAVLHSATRHHGRSSADGRLYQTFRVGVDWSTFTA